MDFSVALILVVMGAGLCAGVLALGVCGYALLSGQSKEQTILETRHATLAEKQATQEFIDAQRAAVDEEFKRMSAADIIETANKLLRESAKRGPQ